VAERQFGGNAIEVGIPLNNLALLYRAEGRYADAELLYERGLTIAEKALGPSHPNVGSATASPGSIRLRAGWRKAEQLLRRALTIAEKAFGPDHPDVGADLNNPAELYRIQGRYAEAEPLYKRVLAIDEEVRHGGPRSPDGKEKK
jgi:tetratricopeptide (TPR) repeat protein